MTALVFISSLGKSRFLVRKWLCQFAFGCGLALGSLVSHAGLFTQEPASAFTDHGASPAPNIELENRPGAEAFTNITVEPGKAGLEKLGQVARAAIQKNPKSGLAHEVLGTVLFYSRDLEGALKEFQQATQLEPGQVGPWNKLGIVQMELGQLDVAEQSLKQSLKIKSDNRIANQRLGLLYEYQKKNADAIQYLKKGLVGTGNETLGVAPNLAQLLNQQGAYDQALEYLAPRAPIHIADANVQSILATSYLGAKQFANASQRYARALELKPDTKEFLLGLAVSQRKNLQLDEAAGTIKTLLAKHSDWKAVYVEQGELALASGQIDAADTAFATAVAKGANPAALDQKIASYYLEKKQPQEAIKRLQAGIVKGTAQPKTYTTLAELQRAQNNLDAGLETLLAGAKKFPKSSLLQFRIGSELAALRRYDESLSYFEKANQLRPQNPDVLRAMSLVQSKLGKHTSAAATAKQLYEVRGEQIPEALFYATLLQQDKQLPQAELVYSRVLQREPENVVALNNLATLQAEQGKLDDAEKNARKANRVIRDNAQLMDTLGWILYQQKRYSEATELLVRATQLAPSSGVIHYHAGVVYDVSGNSTDAKKFLEQALALDDKGSWVTDARQRLAKY